MLDIGREQVILHCQTMWKNGYSAFRKKYTMLYKDNISKTKINSAKMALFWTQHLVVPTRQTCHQVPEPGRNLSTKNIPGVIKSMLVDKNFHDLLMICWQQSRQPIRSHDIRPLLNISFKPGLWLAGGKSPSNHKTGLKTPAAQPTANQKQC